MKNLIVMKSFQNGISIHMDAEADFEEIRKEIAEKFQTLSPAEKKGEFVMICEGSTEDDAFWKDMTVNAHFEHYVSLGLSKMDACKQVARDRGVGKGDIYKIVNS